MGNRSLFPGEKPPVVGAYHPPPPLFKCHGREWIGPHLYHSFVPAWHGTGKLYLYSEINMFSCKFAHIKFPVDWPETDPWPPPCETGDYLRHGRALFCVRWDVQVYIQFRCLSVLKGLVGCNVNLVIFHQFYELRL